MGLLTKYWEGRRKGCENVKTTMRVQKREGKGVQSSMEEAKI